MSYDPMATPLWHIHNMVSGGEFMLGAAIVAATLYLVVDRLGRR
jgi:hypothetical protein